MDCEDCRHLTVVSLHDTAAPGQLRHEEAVRPRGGHPGMQLLWWLLLWWLLLWLLLFGLLLLFNHFFLLFLFFFLSSSSSSSPSPPAPPFLLFLFFFSLPPPLPPHLWLSDHLPACLLIYLSTCLPTYQPTHTHAS